jgi:hypothetical protein
LLGSDPRHADGLPPTPVATATPSVPSYPDSNGDGLSDDFEIAYALDPYNPDSDFDGILVGDEINI